MFCSVTGCSMHLLPQPFVVSPLSSQVTHQLQRQLQLLLNCTSVMAPACVMLCGASCAHVCTPDACGLLLQLAEQCRRVRALCLWGFWLCLVCHLCGRCALCVTCVAAMWTMLLWLRLSWSWFCVLGGYVFELQGTQLGVCAADVRHAMLLHGDVCCVMVGLVVWQAKERAWLMLSCG